MAIDKESTGMPEMNVRKRTTKVNIAMVIGVVVFFAITFSILWWFWASNR